MAKKDVFVLIEQTKEFIAISDTADAIKKIVSQFIVPGSSPVSYDEIKQIESIVKGNHKYTFYKGEEQDFLKFVNDYIKEYGDRDGLAYCIVKFIVRNSEKFLDPNKLWECFDKRQKFNENDFVEAIRRFMLKNMSFKDLQKDINVMDDAATVYNYYAMYGRVNQLQCDKMFTEYVAYSEELMNRVSDKEKTAEQIKNYLTAGFYDILDGVMCDGFAETTLEQKESIVKVIRFLLPRVDLEKEVNVFRDENIKATLKNLLAILLMFTHEHYPCFDAIIGDFADLTNEREFVVGVVKTNIIELCAICGDANRIREFVARDDVNLCDDTKYKLLGMYGKYPENFGRPHDYITSIVPNDNFAHEDLLELLLNDKVKMLDIHVIYNAMVGKYLTPEEIETLMVHIDDNKVLVYDYINGEVTIVMDPIKRLKELKDAEK